MLDWMHWTWQSAVGFAALFTLLAGLTLLDSRRPSYPRKGFLPMATTRGDRVFLSIACFIGLVLVWLRVSPDLTPWVAVGVSAVLAFVLLKWG